MFSEWLEGLSLNRCASHQAKHADYIDGSCTCVRITPTLYWATASLALPPSHILSKAALLSSHHQCHPRIYCNQRHQPSFAIAPPTYRTNTIMDFAPIVMRRLKRSTSAAICSSRGTRRKQRGQEGDPDAEGSSRCAAVHNWVELYDVVCLWLYVLVHCHLGSSIFTYLFTLSLQCNVEWEADQCS